jgi:hypothetical protein
MTLSECEKKRLQGPMHYAGVQALAGASRFEATVAKYAFVRSLVLWVVIVATMAFLYAAIMAVFIVWVPVVLLCAVGARHFSGRACLEHGHPLS